MCDVFDKVEYIQVDRKVKEGLFRETWGTWTREKGKLR